jgi:hypothetical protein
MVINNVFILSPGKLSETRLPTVGVWRLFTIAQLGIASESALTPTVLPPRMIGPCSEPTKQFAELTLGLSVTLGWLLKYPDFTSYLGQEIT